MMNDIFKKYLAQLSEEMSILPDKYSEKDIDKM